MQTYNGSSWSAGTTTPISTNQHVNSAGPATNILAFGGGPGYSNNSIEWDGSSWSSGGSLNVTRNEGSRMGTTDTSAGGSGVLAIGGASPYNTTELYNGSSWSTDVALHTAPTYGSSSSDQGHRSGGNTGGGNARGITSGGGSPPYPSSMQAVYQGEALAALSSPTTFGG
jgi:hypothetical protein